MIDCTRKINEQIVYLKNKAYVDLIGKLLYNL